MSHEQAWQSPHATYDACCTPLAIIGHETVLFFSGVPTSNSSDIGDQNVTEGENATFLCPYRNSSLPQWNFDFSEEEPIDCCLHQNIEMEGNPPHICSIARHGFMGADYKAIIVYSVRLEDNGNMYQCTYPEYCSQWATLHVHTGMLCSLSIKEAERVSSIMIWPSLGLEN